MVDPEVEARIKALVGRQRGYVRRSQLLAVGLGDDAIDHRLRTGRLIRIYAGLYAVGHRPALPHDRAYGAVLACGPKALLAAGSAVTLWGWRKEWKFPFHVIAPSVHRLPNVVVHRSTTLAPQDRRIQLGIRVTSPARTVLDVAPELDRNKLTRLVNDARLSNLSIDDLADVLTRFPRHPGAALLRPVVQAPTGPTRSEFEDAFPDFARTYNFPPYEMNARLGRYEVDVLFPAERLIIELDGWRFHEDRVTRASNLERDAFTLDLGFVTVRLTWERMTQTPAREAERLLRILERRRRERRAA